MMRAIAESVDSETLKPTTCDCSALIILIISSMAPTLLGRKTENCLTSGPSRLDVVSGRSTPMRLTGGGENRNRLENRLCHLAYLVCKRNVEPAFGAHK